MTEPVLSIRDLSICFDTPDGVVHAVDDVSYDVHPGEILAVVGESGCGKTVTALSILGLVPQPPGRIVGGEIVFDGRDLLHASPRELRAIRGADISMIFQDPQTSLNPVYRIGRQIEDVLRAHDRALSRRAARARVIDLLTMVGVPDAQGRASDYPHQWSGGMCQRAMIAMAIANQPRLLIADEPTTALDVTTQAQVLDVLRVARQETGAAAVLITHDLGVVAELADRVVVMYAGRVVETADVRAVFHGPRHPYTLGLMTSLPRLAGDDHHLEAIPGRPPSLIDVPSGCPYHPRCQLRQGRQSCVDDVPELVACGQVDQQSACHFHHEVALPPRRVPHPTAGGR